MIGSQFGLLTGADAMLMRLGIWVKEDGEEGGKQGSVIIYSYPKGRCLAYSPVLVEHSFL